MSRIPPTVLSVEDDLDTREMLKILLEDRGYGFRSVNTCADALDLARQGVAALLLLDNKLPDGSGIELCKEIRQFDRDVPIVFFSGEAFENECLGAGANAFISKPCPLDELFGVLSRLLPQTG